MLIYQCLLKLILKRKISNSLLFLDKYLLKRSIECYSQICSARWLCPCQVDNKIEKFIWQICTCCRYFSRNNIPNLTLIVYIWFLEFVSTLSFVEPQSYVQIILFWKQRISLLLMKQLLTVHRASDLSLINYERAWISIWYHIVFIAFTKPFIF